MKKLAEKPLVSNQNGFVTGSAWSWALVMFEDNLKTFKLARKNYQCSPVSKIHKITRENWVIGAASCQNLIMTNFLLLCKALSHVKNICTWVIWFCNDRNDLDFKNFGKVFVLFWTWTFLVVVSLAWLFFFIEHSQFFFLPSRME